MQKFLLLNIMHRYLLAYSITIVSIIMVESTCPNIITRSAWGARQATTSPLEVNPPPYVIVHHSTEPSCSNQQACSRLVKSFQDYHMDIRKWNDIAYNFLVGEDGNIYEGRGWGKSGAHSPNYNDRSIGICFIGTFSSTKPNSAALNAAKELIACGTSKGTIQTNYKLVGHRQVRQTECPGASLFSEIKSWPQWTPTP